MDVCVCVSIYVRVCVLLLDEKRYQAKRITNKNFSRAEKQKKKIFSTKIISNRNFFFEQLKIFGVKTFFEQKKIRPYPHFPNVFSCAVSFILSL